MVGHVHAKISRHSYSTFISCVTDTIIVNNPFYFVSRILSGLTLKNCIGIWNAMYKAKVNTLPIVLQQYKYNRRNFNINHTAVKHNKQSSLYTVPVSPQYSIHNINKVNIFS